MKTRSSFSIAVVLIGLILAAQFAAAQRTSGEIRGKVFDAASALIPGVELQVKDLATNETRQTISDEVGDFVFLNLQSGVYELTAALAGFQTSVHPRVVVEAARTTNIEVRMRVGALSETVEVTTSNVPVLETTASMISTTVRNTYIQNLPLSGRSTLPFATLMVGAQTPSTDTRNSTFNGLPNASMNISVDGMNNNSQRWKSGGTSFFGFAPTRLDAIEEVTVTTAGSGADAAAGGAMTIRMVTRRGTNEFHGKVFHQIANDALYANSWINNARGLPRNRVRQHDFGGNLGGFIPIPTTQKRLYFFVNFEANPQPSKQTSTQAIPTQDAARGIFKYIGSDNQVRSLNLLQLAGANGYSSQIDPTIQKMLAVVEAAKPKGTILPSTTELNRETLQWSEDRYTGQFYPTARLDYAINDKLAWHGSWNLRHSQFDGVALYPGLADKNNRLLWNNESNVTTYVASNVADWTINKSMLNSFTWGVQSNLENFNQHANVFMWKETGFPRVSSQLNPNAAVNATTNANFITSPVPTGLPFPRNNPVWSLSDNLSWVRGRHTFNFGASYLYTSMYETSYNSAGVPTTTLGIIAADPINSIFNSTNIPFLRSSDLTAALNLYASLTGRVSLINGSRNVDEKTKTYQDFIPRMPRQAFASGGVYFQDSFRATPALTLNYGFRWEISGTHHNTNGIYVDPGLEHLMGPSRQLFAPGLLDGVQSPQLFQKSYSYKSDKINPAPNIGFAWNPGSKKTVVRGAYGINYYDEGMNNLQFGIGGNPGGTQSISLLPGSPGFAAGQLTLQSALPAYVVNPAAFTFPMAQSNFTFISSLASVKPELRTPYVQNWTLGFQRELATNLVVEARYVGNKSTHLWRTYSLSETNIFENGFLQEFINAQRNLAISQTAGVTSFQNRGLPGQTPLPIFEAAFGARGSQPALAAGSSWTSATFINHLQRGTAGGMAEALVAGSAAQTYLCRMTGTNFSPCADAGFNAPGPYPMNFFRHNPFANGTNLLDDNQWGTYHGLQLEARRSFSSGLTVNANYVWSKTLGDYFDVPDSDNSSNYTTLRNRNLDKRPSPFDLRHAFTMYWSYDLPFGQGRRFGGGANGLVNRIISGWTLGGVHRWNSGRAYMLTGGRTTFNQRDSGVILNGLTVGELQNKMRQFSTGPNRNAYHVDPSLIAADGRANPQYLQVPSTPGQLGQYIVLHGNALVSNDLSITKVVPITERLKFTLQTEATNILNHPVLNIGGTGGTISIDSTTFGQANSALVAARQIQMRAQIGW
jgi:hypothetical protein